MKVTNATDTSKLHCPCGSWIEHWKNYTGMKNPACFEVSCRESGTEGAHVYKFDDSRMYIIPLCKIHNGFEFQGKVIEIIDRGVPHMVLADSRDKCTLS